MKPSGAGPDGSGASQRFVSRGGIKLDAALTAFGIDVTGVRALDAGASTGGFTDCLLQRGAAHVVAVDVSYGQLAWTLRNDPRVTVLERTNVRNLTAAGAGGEAGLIVADLAFISLRAVRDALLGLCAPDAQLVLMVKPQFELPRDRVPRGGVVTDPQSWRDAVSGVADWYAAIGCRLAGVAATPITGPKGNREFFVHLVPGSGPEPEQAGRLIDDAVRSAP